MKFLFSYLMSHFLILSNKKYIILCLPEIKCEMLLIILINHLLFKIANSLLSVTCIITCIHQPFSFHEMKKFKLLCKHLFLSFFFNFESVLYQISVSIMFHMFKKYLTVYQYIYIYIHREKFVPVLFSPLLPSLLVGEFKTGQILMSQINLL